MLSRVSDFLSELSKLSTNRRLCLQNETVARVSAPLYDINSSQSYAATLEASGGRESPPNSARQIEGTKADATNVRAHFVPDFSHLIV